MDSDDSDETADFEKFVPPVRVIYAEMRTAKYHLDGRNVLFQFFDEKEKTTLHCKIAFDSEFMTRHFCTILSQFSSQTSKRHRFEFFRRDTMWNELVMMTVDNELPSFSFVFPIRTELYYIV